jgi:IS5 family transposase
LKESIRINGDDSDHPDVNVDTTLQEKNVTFPTDAKLYRKIIKKCHQIAQKESLFSASELQAHFEKAKCGSTFS